MKRKTQIGLVTLAAIASTLAVRSGPGENHAPTIEGVWQVTRGGVNCDNGQALEGTFPALMAFHHDGIVTGAAKSPVTGPFDTPSMAFGNANRAVRITRSGSCSIAMTRTAPSLAPWSSAPT
jgi:hypothetical protein